jgi:2-dehydropantoate 2-reductase
LTVCTPAAKVAHVKIAVIGAGGVGGYFGAKLAHGGCDVVFLVRGRTLETLQREGIRVDSIDGNFSVPHINATDDPAQAGAVDAILLAVKSWQIEEALRNVAPMLKPDTIIVPLENGIDAPALIARATAPEHAAGGLCAIISFTVAPGHIRHAGTEPSIYFGELDDRVSERVQRLQSTLRAAGVRAEVPPNVTRAMWTKFLFITPFSSIGAVTRVPAGVWRELPQTRELARRAVEELVALAKNRGVDLGDDAVARTMERFDEMPPAATSSLQRDIMEGRPSELDAQAGAVVRMAQESGIAAPVHEFLLASLLPQENAVRSK